MDEKKIEFKYLSGILTIPPGFEFHEIQTFNLEQKLLELTKGMEVPELMGRNNDYLLFSIVNEENFDGTAVYILRKGEFKDQVIDNYIGFSSEISLISEFVPNFISARFPIPEELKDDKISLSTYCTLSFLLSDGLSKPFLDLLEEKIIKNDLDWRSFSKARNSLEKLNGFNQYLN